MGRFPSHLTGALQRKLFESFFVKAGAAATDEKVEQYLSEGEPVEPEPELNPVAVKRFKERIRQAKQLK